MTFDPFGDFETRGYLRNIEQEKVLAIVQRLQHASFTTGIDDAFAALAKRHPLTYDDVLAPIRYSLRRFIPGPDKTAARPLHGSNKDPAIQAEYEQQRLKREGKGGGK